MVVFWIPILVLNFVPSEGGGDWRNWISEPARLPSEQAVSGQVSSLPESKCIILLLLLRLILLLFLILILVTQS